MALPDKKVEELLDEYKKDPVSFRLKYGARAEADLLETAHKKGMTEEVVKKTGKPFVFDWTRPAPPPTKILVCSNTPHCNHMKNVPKSLFDLPLHYKKLEEVCK